MKNTFTAAVNCCLPTLALLFALSLGASAQAQETTTTTSTSTSSTSDDSSTSTSSSSSSSSSSSTSSSTVTTLTACGIVGECIYNNVPLQVDSCFSLTPECTTTNKQQFAVTAEQLATLAIQNKKCDTRNFRTRPICNRCFEAAKEPLRDRFFVKLFKGLLGKAVTIIDDQKRSTCSQVRVRR